MVIQEPIEIKSKIYIYNPKPLRQIARDIIKLGDKQLNKELAKNCLDVISL